MQINYFIHFHIHFLILFVNTNIRKYLVLQFLKIFITELSGNNL